MECKKRNVDVDVILHPSNKYSCPFLPHNYKILSDLSLKLNFSLCNLSNETKKREGIIFTVERNLTEADPPVPYWKYTEFFDYSKLKVISLTNCTDFRAKHCGHPKYIQLVENAIFINEMYSNYYDCKSQKNLYLGSPKYDFMLSKEEVLKKYNMKNDNYCLVIAPKLSDLNTFLPTWLGFTSIIRKLGYKIILKSRAKDSYSQFGKNLKNVCDHYYEDTSWFTHTTIDLMTASKIVINTDSTAIEECTMTKRPTINFQLKGGIFLPFLYSNEVSWQYSLNKYNPQSFVDNVKRLTQGNLDDKFNKIIEDKMYFGNSSKAILDYYCR